MSIYRKIAPDLPNDVFATAATKPVAKTLTVDPAAEEAAKKKRKGAPMNAPLPRTFAWAAKLPRDLQPIELMRSHGRIANLMASFWDEPDAMHQYFEELLVDRRGNRQGFPPEVMSELLALRTYYTGQHPKAAKTWENLTKR